MSYETITCNVDGSVMVVTLNRPDKLNAYTSTMGGEIADAFRRADADDAVRAVIVTGAGRAFCAGADVSGARRASTRRASTAQVSLATAWPRMSPARAAASSRPSSIAASRRSPPSMGRPWVWASP